MTVAAPASVGFLVAIMALVRIRKMRALEIEAETCDDGGTVQADDTRISGYIPGSRVVYLTIHTHVPFSTGKAMHVLCALFQFLSTHTPNDSSHAYRKGYWKASFPF